jgi:histidinol-phosphate aminotransferase
LPQLRALAEIRLETDLLRPTLQNLPTYRPGRSAPGATKLSANENPFAPLPGVLEAAASALGNLNTYPDAAATRMLRAIAETFDIPADRLATGTGSVGILQQIVQATAGDGGEVIFAWRSFEAYPIVVQVNGATPIPVPLAANGTHDLDAMAARITPRTRLILLCSPNNPTGTVLTRQAVERFLATVPEDILVVVDEAYAEFVRAPEAVNGLQLLAGHPNLCVLRTFSKAYGLAGLRVGYAAAAPPVAAALRMTAVPFGVSAAAQAAVIASLSLQDFLDERVNAIVSERSRITAELRKQGWLFPNSEANFLWLPIGDRSTAFAAHLEQHGLLVRPYGDDGVRITVADADTNSRALRATAAWALARRKSPEVGGR